MRIPVLSLAVLSAMLAFAEVYPGTITEWLVSGPWPSYHGSGKDTGLDTDFLDLEIDAVPKPGMKAQAEFIADKAKLIAGIGSANEWGFKETRKFDASWRKMSANANGELLFDGVFAPIDDYFAAYACCYVETPEAVDATIALGSDDDHKLWLDLNEVGRKASSQGINAAEFKYNVRLTPGVHRILMKTVDRTNGCGMTLAITDRGGKAIPGLKTFIDPAGKHLVIDDQKAAERAPEKLRASNEAMEKELAALKARMPDLEARLERNRKELARAKRELAAGYAFTEDAYAKKRARTSAKGTKSIDEPIPPASGSIRRRLLINGIWEASANGGKTWEKRSVPIKYIDRYFASWLYPVSRTRKDTPWCAYTNNTGFADLNISDTLLRGSDKGLLLRTHFDWDGEGRVQYVCEGIIACATFFCNGRQCGEYDGRVGIVTIPLASAVKGRNKLEIKLDWIWSANHHSTDGILGDSFIDQVADVHVTDTYAKPSWRNSTLAVEAEVANDGADEKPVEVRSYAVKGGRVRFRLPVMTGRIAPGAKKTLKTIAGWSDPVVWGIGGKYGNPELYDLVTDVVVDGKTVDRHVQSFGFREFWVRHTDFFLNGRRIILQGDTGHPGISACRHREITWKLLREDGINIARYHDSEYWSVNAARGADRMGMLCYLQMYPVLHERTREKPNNDNFLPFEEWEKTSEHAWNLANYERWFRAFRNCPSVVIWSTDNEILTQAWDTDATANLTVRNDRVGSLYEKFMKKLEPGLVMTRDGDIGTWGSVGRWHEDPPCDTANYHYPDFNVDKWVRDWQSVYEWRPAVFGETLYCSYGAWDNWIGAIPSQVEKKAARVRSIATLYRELEVPGQIYMGLASDGFIQIDDTGKGNPQGITSSEFKTWQKTGKLPHDQKVDQFPWFRLNWPAMSGSESRPIAYHVAGRTYGHDVLNIYDDRYPTHVRNKVNEAYRDSLLPQPPLRIGTDAEIIIEVDAGAEVWATSPDGTRKIGVRADDNGRAWFRYLEPGQWRFSCGSTSASLNLLARGDKVADKAGFGIIRTEKLK